MNSQHLLESALTRAQDIYPAVRRVNVGTRSQALGHGRFSCGIGHDEDLGGGFILGFGDTPEDAVSAACDELRGLLDAEHARTRCCVDGCAAASVATTGEGMMCREHALAWLQSESESADEVGPCGVAS
ncbi:MAG: hypothetical protein GY772_31855 [bacterium]|nr:hypothetical protein [bacterium]